MDNKIVNGQIIDVTKTYLEVKLPNGQVGIVHISQVSDYYIQHLEILFEKGEYGDFVVLNDKNTTQVELGWKQIHPRFLKNPFEFEILETKSQFHNLKQAAAKEVEGD